MKGDVKKFCFGVKTGIHVISLTPQFSLFIRLTGFSVIIILFFFILISPKRIFGWFMCNKAAGSRVTCLDLSSLVKSNKCLAGTLIWAMLHGAYNKIFLKTWQMVESWKGVFSFTCVYLQTVHLCEHVWDFSGGANRKENPQIKTWIVVRLWKNWLNLVT